MTKKQLENVFLKYVNDQQTVSDSDVRAFAICLRCGLPLYRSEILMNTGRSYEYVERVFHFNYQMSLCDKPRWRKR